MLLDHNGHLSEGIGSNIFLVSEGEVLTPRSEFVLPGHQPRNRHRAVRRSSAFPAAKPISTFTTPALPTKSS